MNDTTMIRLVARRLFCDERHAEERIAVVLQELHDRLTPKEADDVAAQLPPRIKRVWRENDASDRTVARYGRAELIDRVKRRAGLADEDEAEQTVKAVFHVLQNLLGSATGKEGEAWDILSQLPKDLKLLWLEAGEPSRPREED